MHARPSPVIEKKHPVLDGSEKCLSSGLLPADCQELPPAGSCWQPACLPLCREFSLSEDAENSFVVFFYFPSVRVVISEWAVRALTQSDLYYYYYCYYYYCYYYYYYYYYYSG